MKTLLRKTFRGALAITILCLMTTAGADSRGLKNNYGIIPMPYSIEAKAGKSFQINAETVIVYRDKERKTSAKYLQERIAGSTGMKLAIKKSGSPNVIVLQVEPEIVLAPYPSDHRAVVATFTLPNQPRSEKLETRMRL